MNSLLCALCELRVETAFGIRTVTRAAPPRANLRKVGWECERPGLSAIALASDGSRQDKNFQ